MSKPLPPTPEQLQDPDPSIRGSRRRMTIYYNVNQEPDVGLPLAQLGTIDIADPIKQRYVEVLSKQTIDAQNSIPIAPNSSVGRFYETPDPEQIQYISNDGNNPSGVPNAITNFFVTPSQFNFIGSDRKGVSEPSKINTRTFQVNRYVKNINTNPAEHGALIDKQLLSTTGFNSLGSNQFVVIDGTQENPDNRLKIGPIYYDKKGAYKNTSFVGQPTLNGSTVTATSMSLEHLKKIGLNILYDAVQAGAGPDIDPTNGDGGFSEAEAGMAVPSLPRIGKKVRLSRFSPSYEAKKLFGVDKPNNPSFIDNEVGENPTMTYGNFYNPFSQFDSLISLGQIAVCVAMVISFVVILELASIAIPHDGRDAQAYNPQATNHANSKILGTSTVPNLAAYPTDGMSGGEFLQQFLGIKGLFTYTFHAFDDCLQNGLEEFFGVPGLRDGTGTALASGALRILLESGRLNTVLRDVIRNGIDIITSSDLNGGPYSIEAVGRLIRNIRDSKILKFVNVLAQIGDKIAWELELKGERTKVGSNVSVIDLMPESRPFVIAKSRLSNGSLAWGNSNSPMLHLPLTSLFVTGADGKARLETGIDSYGNAISNLTVLDLNLRYNSLNGEISSLLPVSLGGENRSFPTKNRLSKELVEKMEEQLEADYMPFYVQDLRTNEILSFHAFLEDAAEDFSVEYTQQDGYGRMDKVQIYKGTTRKINVSFKMVATNEEDHDLMWYKINRLAMTIYPQWTQGREVNVGGIKFIQPFSQIPGATPVVRLRLGDLWRSNYSKQSIARLFGATTREDFNVFGYATDQIRLPRESSNHIKMQNLMRVFQNGSFVTTSTQERSDNSLLLNPGDVFTPNRSKIILKGEQASGYLNANFEPPEDGGHWNFSDGFVECVYLETTPTSVFLEFNKVHYDIIDITGLNLIPLSGRSKRIDISIGYFSQNLIDSEKTIQNLEQEQRLQETQGQQAEQGLNDLNPNQFFNDTQNPILKSFSSTYGKGLAGVVTEFKVDYGEAKGAWGINGNSFLRAPKFVTINLGMQVIHDIPLGLDANGIMNAPIWSVGNMSRQLGGITEPVGSLQDRSNLQDRTAQLGTFQARSNPLINRR